MAKTINLGRKPSSTAQNPKEMGVEPPVGGQIRGRMPLPVGKPMVLKKVSPSEREILEQAGWKDGDPVPENFHEIVAEARKSVEGDLPPPDGLSMNMPPLKVPREVDISSLPPERQAEYQEILALALRQAAAEDAGQREVAKSMVSGAGQGVNDAIMASQTQDDLVDDRNAREYASGAPKASPEPAKSIEPEEYEIGEAEEESTLCPRCGHDVRVKTLEVDNSDKIAFLLSVLSGADYMKAYTLYNGHLTVTLRTLSTKELDECAVAARRYAKNHEDDPGVIMNATFARYRAALQLVEWATAENKITAPGDLKAWDMPVEDIAEQVFNEGCRSESSQRLLMNASTEFNLLVATLEANVQNADFWPAIDQLNS